MFVALISLVYNGVCYFFWLMGLLHRILPIWLEAAGGVAALYYGTRLRQPAPEDVESVFGERASRCIAHRGAGLDAPENTIAAFKYCADNACDFVEFDVRSCADGRLVLMHDADTGRLTGGAGLDVAVAGWDALSRLDIAAAHPNRAQFGATRVCTLDEALDYLAERNMRAIIDVKGDDKTVVSGVVRAFASRPLLRARAAVTAFNPLVLYRIRRRDPRIVGALSYRPHCFSHGCYDAENGPAQPRMSPGSVAQGALRAADALHAILWRAAARWCRVSAVLLHKDIVSPSEAAYWRGLGVRTVGWSVNRPLEKLYWRGVLRAPYLADTLLGEPAQDKKSASPDFAVPSSNSHKFQHQNGGTSIGDLSQHKE